jgi:centrosomal protein CEP120
MEETMVKLKKQLAEAESKVQQQIREFEAYKNQLHSKPEVRLQSEINLLTLEKV